ncbi:hypothetical protein MGN70_009080 [Eutypa lata]|nr:hypothetical protein MGN70_009080 [Eutypa lata]
MADETEDWSKLVTEADVDDVLRQAGADLNAFNNAPMRTDRSPTPPPLIPRTSGTSKIGRPREAAKAAAANIPATTATATGGTASHADAVIQSLRNGVNVLQQTVARERQSREPTAAELERMRHSFRDDLRREMDTYVQGSNCRVPCQSNDRDAQEASHIPRGPRCRPRVIPD